MRAKKFAAAAPIAPKAPHLLSQCSISLQPLPRLFSLCSPFTSSTTAAFTLCCPSNHPSLALHLLLLPSRLRPGLDCFFFSAAENTLSKTSAPAPPSSSLLGSLRQLKRRRRQSIKSFVPFYAITTTGLSVIAPLHRICRYPCAPWVSREFYFFKPLLGPMAAHTCAPRLLPLLPAAYRVSGAAVAPFISLAIAARLHRAEYLGRLVDCIFGRAVKSSQSSCLIFFASLFFRSYRRCCFD